MKRLAIIAALCAVAGQASACSVCIANALGAGLAAIGAQTLPKGMAVWGVSYFSFTKSQIAMAEEEEGTHPMFAAGPREVHLQSQYNLDVAYGISNLLMVQATVPYVTRSLQAPDSAPVNTEGLGDCTLGLTWQMPPRWGDKALIAFTGEVKFATGQNSMRGSDGNLLEEHSQIGTGSTDYTLGVRATSEVGRGLAFAGLRYRANGENGRGFRYGNVTFYNVGYSMTLDEQSSLILEFTGRIADRDRVGDGTKDPESGGHLGFLSLSARRSLGGGLGLIASYQTPLVRKLNGTQSESSMFTLGLTGKF